MKQKRKVKNLLQNQRSVTSNVMAAILFITSGVLCLAALAIFAMGKVSLADEPFLNLQDIQELQYVGVNDRTESVYEVKFINERNQTEYSIKQEGLSLYVGPRPVVIWSDVDHVYKINTVSEGVYGNILGGQQNDVESDNVTIIAGEKNTVLGGNEDATILGGIENEIKEGEGSRTAILVGGYKNHIYSSKGGTTIIGGNENDIKNNASDVTILGGSNNEVGGNNVIVGGTDVKVADNQQDIFVFNNDRERNINISSVDSSSSDTFYIYSKGGLGINTEASTNGVEAKGGISLGTIDITNKICNDKTLGLIGMWEGCLVGCTEKSRELGGWELINPTEKDKEECEKNNKCIDTSVPYEDTILEVDGSCNNGLVDEESLDPERSTICGNPSLYKNIVFETTLIDSAYKEDGGESGIKCPQAGGDQRLINNQCVYQCNKGYHLLKDETNKVGGRSGKIGCYKDCMLDGVPVKHNETIDGYNVREVTCSNNEYVFPYKSFPTNSLFTKIANGISPETCGNSALGGHHKELLICIDGKLYLESDRTTPANEKYEGDKEDAYNKASCELKQYRCDTSDYNYNLSMKWLRLESGNPIIKVTPKTANPAYSAYVTPYEDRIPIYMSKSIMLSAPDRSQPRGFISNGTYELCIDFDPHTGTNETCDRVGLSVNDETKYHYKLVRCNDDGETKYWTGATHPYECRTVYTLTYDANRNATYPTNSVTTQTKTTEQYTWGSPVPVARTDSNAAKATKKDPRDNTYYEFLGWNTNPDATTALTSFTMPSNNVTLYAIYKRTYTANFDKNGATSIGSTQLTCDVWNNTHTCTVKGPTIARTSKDSANPFTILGWNTNKNASTGTPAGQNLTIPAVASTTSTTWYAITKKGLTITFYKNGNISQTDSAGTYQTTETVTRACTILNTATTCSITSPTINTSEIVDVLNSANKVKKTLIGYSTAANRHENDYPVNTARNFEDNTSFYAQSKKDITVTFKLNGNISQTDSNNVSQLGDVTRKGTYYNGETYYTIKSPGLDPNKTPVQKAVIGYSTAACRHANDWSVNTNKNISDNVVYYAQSKKDVTVTFNVNGNQGSNTTKSCTYYNAETSCGSTACNDATSKSIVCPAITANKTPVQKTVMAWSTMSNEFHTACAVNGSINPTNNVTYYAWSKKTVTVTFDVNGNQGSNSSAQCEYYNGATSCNVTCPGITANKTPVQKSVLGWGTTASSCSANACNVNTAKAVSDNVTYYAQSKKDVTVTFNVNGNQGSNSTATCSYCNAATSCNVTCPGITANKNPVQKTVIGWGTATNSYSANACNVNTSKAVLDNITYYAQSKKDVTVSFNKNGATSIGSASLACTYYNAGTSCNITSPSITRANWSILGWNTSASSTSSAWNVSASKAFGDNATYYAITSQACAAGKYSKDGENACQTCAAGTSKGAASTAYNTNTNGNLCACCAAGSYTSSAGASACTACVKSTASVAGTYQGSTCKTSCTTASDGYYTTAANATAQTQCPAGYYCPGGKLIQCPCGSYCPVGSTNPTACGGGKYSAAGSTSSSDCKNITAGYYGTSACSATPNKCPAGTYSKAGASSCSSCPTGQYSAAGSSSCSSCTNAPANASYTSNATSNSCSWSCNSCYTKNSAGTACNINTCPVSGACSASNYGTTCTSYARCSSTKITSTCQCNGTWSTTPGAYSSAGQGCKSCTICGATVAHGNSRTCYENSAPTGSACKSESRKCTDGTASGTYGNASCTAYCPASGACSKTAAGGTCTSYARCSSTKITSTCQSNGTWSTTPGAYSSAGQGCKSCTICGATVAHGNSRTCYADDDPTGACSSQTRTCNDGTASGTYGYASCNAGCGYPYKHGNTVTTYARCSSSAIVSTCKNGSWTPGTGAYSSAGQGCKSCTICGATVAHGNSRTCYSDDDPTGACSSQSRKCTDGTASGSYGYASCNAGCGYPYKHGSTVTTYARCSSDAIVSTCKNGSWSPGTGAYSSAGQGCRSCTVCGKTVAHGQSVTKYFGSSGVGSCPAANSTCVDGNLAGPGADAQYCSCTVYCAASGGCSQTAVGGPCTSYQYPTHSNCSTYSKTSTCASNGQWSSTPYAYSSCSAPVLCPASGGCPQTGVNGTCTTYSASQISTFASCNNYKRVSTCRSGGSWDSRPYAYSSCAPKPYDACDYACKSGGGCQNGFSITSYNANNKVTCTKANSGSCTTCTRPSGGGGGGGCVTGSVANPC